MIFFLWVVVACVCAFSGYGFLTLMDEAETAMQEIAIATFAIALAVIPYCFVRAVSELGKILDGGQGEEEEARICSWCKCWIHAEAVRCPFCHKPGNPVEA